MATLADVNNSLVGLQKANEDGDARQAALLSRLDKRFDRFFKQLEEIESEDQEADIEARNRAREASASEKNEVSKSKGGGSGFSMPPIFGGLFAGGLTGAISGIGGALLKRGIPGLIVTMLADEIADFLQANVSGVSDSMRDMVERSLSIGGLGLIFGPKFALIGAAIGAVLTPENREALTKLGETASGLADKFKKMFNVQFPSLETILNKITTTVGGAIDGIDKLLQGDFKGFIAEIDDVGLTMAGLFALFMPGKAVSLALRGLMLPFVAAKAGIMAMLGKNKADVSNLTNEAKRTTSKQGVTKGGEKVTLNEKTGRYHNEKGKMVKGADVKEIGKKFPKMGKFLKIPFVGQVMAVSDLIELLMSPGSIGSKVDDLSGILGGLGGSALGGIAGLALSTLTGPAAVVMGPLLGALGAGGGYFLGDMIAKGLAQYLLGQKVDAFPEIVNNALNGESTDVSSVNTNSGVPTSVDGGLAAAASSRRTVSSVPNNTGATMATSTAGAVTGPPNTQIIDASTSQIDASSNQSIAMGNVVSTDPHDMMFGAA